MTENLIKNAALRQIELWSAEVCSELRADGSTLIWQKGELPAYPPNLSVRIEHWAYTTPEQIWMGERDAQGQWTEVTYAQLFQRMQSIAQHLLGLALSTDRPLIILSGNSIAHALIALAAQHVGIPSAAIAPAYSLSGTYEKLQAIKEQITPGAVFVDNPAAFMPAISTLFSDLPLLCVEDAESTTAWLDVINTEVTQEVKAANASVDANTIAKFMFTSGTTGSPKAVIQTQGMMCSNQAMVADCFAYMKKEPPIILDWAPWNHVASGSKVFNMSLYNGGTYYIDEGKPAPHLIGQTIQNIRDISPSWYFNVPAGYEMLVEAMQQDDALANAFFKNMKLMMYAGAAMAEHTWKNLDSLAVKSTGERIMLSTGLGATETAPFALFCTEPQDVPGNVGIPSKGLVMKLVPHEGKNEVRIKGPSITPGYWRNEKLTAEAFDDEGFYCMGDALRYADEDDPGKGFFFDGRVAENFKMATGTWVAVGALRAALGDALQGLARDVVIAGEGRQELVGLLIPFRPAALRVMENAGEAMQAAEALSDEDLFAHPTVVEKVQELLSTYNKKAGGSSLRVPRVMFITDALSLDAGEITDKGSVNQRAILKSRANLVDVMYAHEDDSSDTNANTNNPAAAARVIVASR